MLTIGVLQFHLGWYRESKICKVHIKERSSTFERVGHIHPIVDEKEVISQFHPGIGNLQLVDEGLFIVEVR